MSVKRAVKVAGLIKAAIGDIIQTQLKDPRVGFVTITDVALSDDLKIARVYFSTMGDEAQRANSLQGLERARAFIMNALGRRVRLRYLPELRFFLDDTWAYGEKIDRIIDTLHPAETDGVDE